MSLVRKGIFLFLAFSMLALLVGCGSSNSNSGHANSVGFSNTSFSGTYVFSTQGSDANTGGLLTLAGILSASNGNLSGTVDVVAPDGNYGITRNAAISSGSYSVGSDGRGQATFNVAVPAGTATFVLDFVLTSNTHGLVTEFDTNGSGSGTIDLQPAAPAQSTFNSSYAFALAGGNTSSFALAGALTLDSNGNVLSGTEDINNNGSASTVTLPPGGVVTVGSGTTPGSATIGTYSYDVFPIDTTHFKLIEVDGIIYGTGDAFTQAASLPVSSTLTFAMSGGDSSGFPIGVAGFMPLDTASNILAPGREDFNDGGNIGTTSSFTGGFSALTAGRSVLSVSSFVNGESNDIGGAYAFAAYPFTSNGITGMFLLESDTTGFLTSGVAYVQTGTSLGTSQSFGLNLTAINVGNGQGGFFEEDDIGQFNTSSSSITGVVDLNDEGSTTFKNAFSSDYQTVTTGEYNTTTSNLFSFNMYAVNAQTFLLLEVDGTQIGTGIAELQSPTSSPGPEPGIFMPGSAVRARSATVHHK